MITARRRQFITTVAAVLVLLVISATGQAQVSAPFRVYLAFEDGPTRAYTPEILDILAEYGAHASFVISGAQIAGHEDIIQRELREGHALINHLWEEPGVYAGAPADAVIESYRLTEAALREAIGPDLLPVYDAQVRMFWQPGGAAQPFPVVDDIQVITYNWNVNSDDCGWAMPDTVDLDTSAFDEAVIANVLGDPVSTGIFHNPYNAYDYGDGVIIIFHDLNRVTGRVLPTILSQLSAAGATFETLPRQGDVVGTMPVALGTPPDLNRPGIAGFTMPVEVRETANLRVGPGLSYAVDGSAAAGEQLTAIGRNGAWLLVDAAPTPLWISRSLISPLGAWTNLPLVEV